VFIFTVVKKSCFVQKGRMVPICLQSLNCTKFGQLILHKTIKIVATRGQILRLNAPNSISAGAVPQTPLGELTALPLQTPYLDLRGLLLKEGEGKERREGKEEGGESERGSPPPHTSNDI